MVFGHRERRLIDLKNFEENSDAALEAYSAAEYQHRDEDWIDIVLVGSGLLDTVQLRHANYFNGGAAVRRRSRFLQGIA